MPARIPFNFDLQLRDLLRAGGFTDPDISILRPSEESQERRVTLKRAGEAFSFTLAPAGVGTYGDVYGVQARGKRFVAELPTITMQSAEARRGQPRFDITTSLQGIAQKILLTHSFAEERRTSLQEAYNYLTYVGAQEIGVQPGESVESPFLAARKAKTRYKTSGGQPVSDLSERASLNEAFIQRVVAGINIPVSPITAPTTWRDIGRSGPVFTDEGITSTSSEIYGVELGPGQFAGRDYPRKAAKNITLNLQPQGRASYFRFNPETGAPEQLRPGEGGIMRSRFMTAEGRVPEGELKTKLITSVSGIPGGAVQSNQPRAWDFAGDVREHRFDIIGAGEDITNLISGKTTLSLAERHKWRVGRRSSATVGTYTDEGGAHKFQMQTGSEIAYFMGNKIKVAKWYDPTTGQVARGPGEGIVSTDAIAKQLGEKYGVPVEQDEDISGITVVSAWARDMAARARMAGVKHGGVPTPVGVKVNVGGIPIPVSEVTSQLKGPGFISESWTAGRTDEQILDFMGEYAGIVSGPTRVGMQKAIEFYQRAYEGTPEREARPREWNRIAKVFSRYSGEATTGEGFVTRMAQGVLFAGMEENPPGTPKGDRLQRQHWEKYGLAMAPGELWEHGPMGYEQMGIRYTEARTELQTQGLSEEEIVSRINARYQVRYGKQTMGLATVMGNEEFANRRANTFLERSDPNAFVARVVEEMKLDPSAAPSPATREFREEFGRAFPSMAGLVSAEGAGKTTPAIKAAQNLSSYLLWEGARLQGQTGNNVPTNVSVIGGTQLKEISGYLAGAENVGPIEKLERVREMLTEEQRDKMLFVSPTGSTELNLGKGMGGLLPSVNTALYYSAENITGSEQFGMSKGWTNAFSALTREDFGTAAKFHAGWADLVAGSKEIGKSMGAVMPPFSFTGKYTAAEWLDPGEMYFRQEDLQDIFMQGGMTRKQSEKAWLKMQKEGGALVGGARFPTTQGAKSQGAYWALSQQAAAERAGMTKREFRKWEQGVMPQHVALTDVTFGIQHEGDYDYDLAKILIGATKGDKNSLELIKDPVMMQKIMTRYPQIQALIAARHPDMVPGVNAVKDEIQEIFSKQGPANLFNKIVGAQGIHSVEDTLRYSLDFVNKGLVMGTNYNAERSLIAAYQALGVDKQYIEGGKASIYKLGMDVNKIAGGTLGEFVARAKFAIRNDQIGLEASTGNVQRGAGGTSYRFRVTEDMMKKRTAFMREVQKLGAIATGEVKVGEDGKPTRLYSNEVIASMFTLPGKDYAGRAKALEERMIAGDPAAVLSNYIEKELFPYSTVTPTTSTAEDLQTAVTQNVEMNTRVMKQLGFITTMAERAQVRAPKTTEESMAKGPGIAMLGRLGISEQVNTTEVLNTLALNKIPDFNKLINAIQNIPEGPARDELITSAKNFGIDVGQLGITTSVRTPGTEREVAQANLNRTVNPATRTVIPGMEKEHKVANDALMGINRQEKLAKMGIPPRIPGGRPGLLGRLGDDSGRTGPPTIPPITPLAGPPGGDEPPRFGDVSGLDYQKTPEDYETAQAAVTWAIAHGEDSGGSLSAAVQRIGIQLGLGEDATPLAVTARFTEALTRDRAGTIRAAGVDLGLIREVSSKQRMLKMGEQILSRIPGGEPYAQMLETIRGKEGPAAAMGIMADVLAKGGTKQTDVPVASAERLNTIFGKLKETMEKLGSSTENLTDKQREALEVQKTTLQRAYAVEWQVVDYAKIQRQAELGRAKMTAGVGITTAEEKAMRQEAEYMGAEGEQRMAEKEARQPSSYIAGFARHLLGGWGLMYMRAIAGYATQGMDFGYQQAAQWSAMTGMAGAQALGIRQVPYSQQQQLQNQMALAGANYSPMVGLNQLRATNPLLNDILSTATSGMGTFAGSIWVADAAIPMLSKTAWGKNIISTGKAAGLTAEASMMGALMPGAALLAGGVAAISLGLTGYAKGKDPASLAYRTMGADIRGTLPGPTDIIGADLLVIAEQAQKAKAGWAQAGPIGQAISRFGGIDALATMYTPGEISTFKQTRGYVQYLDTIKRMAVPPTIATAFAGMAGGKQTAESRLAGFQILASDILSLNKNLPQEAVNMAASYMVSNNMAYNPAFGAKLAADYATGIGTADVSTAMLGAMGYNPYMIMSSGRGANLTSELMKVDMPSAEKTALITGSQFISQISNIMRYQPGGAASPVAITGAELKARDKQYAAIAGQPAGDVFLARAQLWYAKAGAGIKQPSLQTAEEMGLARPVTIREGGVERIDYRATQMDATQALQGVARDQAQIQAWQAYSRVQLGTNLQTTLAGRGSMALGQRMFDMLVPGAPGGIPFGQEAMWQGAIGGDPQALARLAASRGVGLEWQKPLQTIYSQMGVAGKTPISAEYGAFVDYNVQTGMPTGLAYGTTGMGLSGVPGAQMAQRIWGQNWQQNPMLSQGAMNAMVYGVQRPGGAAITVPGQAEPSTIAGGQFGFQYWQNQQQYQYAQAQAGLQYRGLELTAQYTQAQWGIEDKMRTLGYAQADWQYDFSKRQLALQQSQFMENFALNKKGAIQQRGWTKEDWGYQEQVRDLQWGWRLEDFNESARFMSGRQRRLAERGMARETIMHDLEGEQIGKNRERQKQLWKLEDERFALQLKQFKESFAMQEEQLKKQREFYLERKKLEEEQIKLQRQYWLDQQELQKESIALSLAYAKTQYEIQNTMIMLNESTALTTGALGDLATNALDPIFQNILNVGIPAITQATELFKGMWAAMLNQEYNPPAEEQAAQGTDPFSRAARDALRGRSGASYLNTHYNVSAPAGGYNREPQTINVYIGNERLGEFVINHVQKELRR